MAVCVLVPLLIVMIKCQTCKSKEKVFFWALFGGAVIA